MLPWLTAWARLVVDDGTALEVANRAVARAASGRKALKPLELRVAARAEACRLLARGAAAVPSVENASGRGHATAALPTSSPVATTTAYAPPASAAEADGPKAPESVGAGDTRRAGPDPREQTETGRLAIALERLAPYERLACVAYFVDGASTDAIASLLAVPRERAIRILEGAAPGIARAVGDDVVPDFSAATDEVEVVAR